MIFFVGFFPLSYFNWALFLNKKLWINLYKFNFLIILTFYSQPNTNKKKTKNLSIIQLFYSFFIFYPSTLISLPYFLSSRFNIVRHKVSPLTTLYCKKFLLSWLVSYLVRSIFVGFQLVFQCFVIGFVSHKPITLIVEKLNKNIWTQNATNRS